MEHQLLLGNLGCSFITRLVNTRLGTTCPNKAVTLMEEPGEGQLYLKKQQEEKNEMQKEIDEFNKNKIGNYTKQIK